MVVIVRRNVISMANRVYARVPRMLVDGPGALWFSWRMILVPNKCKRGRVEVTGVDKSTGTDITVSSSRSTKRTESLVQTCITGSVFEERQIL